MARTFFDNNENLNINGDVNFFSIGSGSGQDGHDYLQVTQHVQATNAHSQTLKEGADPLDFAAIFLPESDDLWIQTLTGYKILCDSTAPTARYESDHSFTGPRCHPGTRLAVQDHIVKWLDDEDGPIAMWMSGPVGIGKSAIARTVADVAAVRMQLSSAFFFFRSDEARNTTKHLVATLAYEMTQQMPYTLEPVCTAITANPLIFSSPLERQISATLLQPLSTPSVASLRVHRLIIIDGLDECIDTNIQRTIIRSFILGLLSVSAEIIPHRILIVSRPESHITSAFSAPDISCHVKHLALESWDTEDDIGTFLRAKLDEIQQTHPLKHYLPDVWPSDYSFRRLRRHSIGSFAYASIVIRHLASHNDSPERALQDLLSLQPRRAVTAFANLDALYRHILLSLDPEMLFMLQKVLCLYVYARCKAIDKLTEFLSEDRFTVEIALIRTSSLIQFYHDVDSENDSDGHSARPIQKIKFHHTSFEEFLLDKDRSGDLYIFCPNVASAAAIALSRLWLHPSAHLYQTFSSMSPIVDDTQDRRLEDMHVYIANTLIATKLPTSFCYDAPRSLDPEDLWPSMSVADFCLFLQWKSQGCSKSIHRFIYSQAFSVISDWLRSQFYRFFKGPPTAKAILDITLEYSRESLRWSYPFMDIFRTLTIQAEGSFYCLHRVFPEIRHLEIYSELLDRYQAELLRRDTDTTGKYRANLPDFFSELYYQTCIGVKLPEFSQRLEEMVLEGMKALGLVPNVYRCYLDSDYQLVTGKTPDMDRWPKKINNLSLAEKTDRYIRQTHMIHDFPYISQEVGAFYCAASPTPFLFEWRMLPTHWWDEEEWEEQEEWED